MPVSCPLLSLEDQAAKSSIININEQGHDYHIGVIEVPGFYIDFKAYRQGDPEYRSTTRDVRRLLGELSKQNVDGIVLDLRNNPGGVLTGAVGVSDAFLDKGEIVSTRGRDPQDGDRFNAEPGDLAEGKPMVVLINGGSASASEIVSGAIQDWDRGVIMGHRTYGKGLVQTVMPLRGDGAMRLTTARYYTPSGRSIHRERTRDGELVAVYRRDGSDLVPEVVFS
mgnify:CR=1 FL=1